MSKEHPASGLQGAPRPAMTNHSSGIVDLAHLAANHALRQAPVKTTDPAKKRVTWIPDFDEPGPLADFKSAVLSEPFGHLRAGWVQYPGGGMIIQDHVLPTMIIHEVGRGASTKRFVDDALNLAKTNSAALYRYVALTGVSVQEAVPLCDDLEIVPWTEVPDDPNKLRCDVPRADLRHLFSSVFWPMIVRPSCALRCRLSTRQILFADSGQAPEIPPDELLDESQRSSDVLRCITAYSLRPVGTLGSWLSSENRVASMLVGSGFRYGDAVLSPNVSWDTASLLPKVELTELYADFEKFARNEKPALRIALDRLGQALRRLHTEDRAIDLGVALEVMLLHDLQEGEFTFRMALRGALLLGGGKAERLSNLRLLKSAYGLRSKAVHSGRLDEDASETLAKVAEACASIALKLIARGSFPNWDEDYVIGGE